MSLNVIKKIIPFDKKYELGWLEDKDIKIMHPVSEYFLKLDDLSLNLLIALKWIKWGYFFFSSISKSSVISEDKYPLCEIIDSSIQSAIINTIERPPWTINWWFCNLQRKWFN